MKTRSNIALTFFVSGIISCGAFAEEVQTRPGYSTLSTLHKLSDDSAFTPLHKDCLDVVVKPKVTEQELESVARKLVKKRGEISGRLLADVVMKSNNPRKILRIWNDWRDINDQTYWLCFVYFREVILSLNYAMMMDDSKAKRMETLYNSLQDLTMSNDWQPATRTGKLMYLELAQCDSLTFLPKQKALERTGQYLKTDPKFMPFRWFRHIFSRIVTNVPEKSDDDVLFCLRHSPSNPTVLFGAVSHFNRRRPDISHPALKKFIAIGDYQFQEEEDAQSYVRALGVK
jgi:hypothetical protein